MSDQVILEGQLTTEPKMQYTPEGIPIASFRLVVSPKNNKIKQAPTFIDIVISGEQAQNCSQFLCKGSLVHVEGRSKERKCKPTSAQRRKFKVVATSVRLL